MKRIFTIVVLIASLVFTSCEDFLTEDVRGQLNVDTYYKSIEECESAVTSCYQAMTIWRMVANQHRVVTFRNVWR